MKVVLFEDEATYNFDPLTLTRGAFDLRLGVFSFSDRARRVLRASKDSVHYLARDYIAAHIRARDGKTANQPDKIDEEALFVNGLLLLDSGLAKLISKAKPGAVGVCKDRVAFAKFGQAPSVEVARLLMNAPGNEAVDSILSMSLEKISVDSNALITNYWEIIGRNAHQIASDLGGLKGRRPRSGVKVLGKASSVTVGSECEIGPNVVLDAGQGPIYIGDKTVVHPFTWIQGPAYVGPNTIIQPNSVIREGSNIGEVCRIGGEVEETVFQAYSNKPHAGFAGHMYVGEWVNLGALFTNSDLKNTYGTISVMVKGKKVDSGTTKLGGMVGDHSKASIGSLLYTGKRVGVSSQIHGAVEEDVPSFLFYGKTVGYPNWEIMPDPAIRTAKRVMARRGVEMTSADEKLLKQVFDMTQPERDSLNPGKGPFQFS